MATREIRARTGQLEDPLPAGKKLAEREFPKITPSKHDGMTTSTSELSKGDIAAHKEELQNMDNKGPKHGGEPIIMSKHFGNVKSTSAMSSRESKMGGYAQ